MKFCLHLLELAVVESLIDRAHMFIIFVEFIFNELPVIFFLSNKIISFL